MTKTPNHLIRRIPVEPDVSLEEMVDAELSTTRPIDQISEFFSKLLESESNDERLSTLLDWAMQLRTEESLDWAEALEVGATFLYG